jgi:predicted metal-dependent hydrolase
MFNASISPITISYRPKNRNTYITITHEGGVCVRTPLKDENHIRKIVAEKEAWINAKLITVHARAATVHTEGESICFRGEIMSLEQFDFFHKMLKKDLKTINIKKYYHQFYKNEALLTLPSRINHYSKKIGLTPCEIRYKQLQRRWGSCNSEGVVTFNIQMMQLSYEHIDYIIVHELAHLKHMNHSAEFHALVRTILKNEKQLRSELKEIRMA